MALLKDLRSEVRNELEEICSDMSKQKKDFESTLLETEAEFLSDVQEIERRKNNLMILEIWETDSGSMEERKKMDREVGC